MERRVILFIAMSLDGMIADAGGGVGWIEGHNRNSGEDYGYSEFLQEIDTVIMGMTTYRQVVTELSPKHWPYEGMKSYVLTTKDTPNNKEAEFICCDLSEFIRSIKREKGKDIWVMGGADMANQLIKDNLIDEYQISVIPVILGSGIPLFARENTAIKLQLRQSVECNGVVSLYYTRRNP